MDSPLDLLLGPLNIRCRPQTEFEYTDFLNRWSRNPAVSNPPLQRNAMNA